jgi:hypothetical protein
MFSNTNYDTNQLALLAWRFNDRGVTRDAFDQMAGQCLEVPRPLQPSSQMGVCFFRPPLTAQDA